jgi:CheY-like chemotaxis protein
MDPATVLAQGERPPGGASETRLRATRILVIDDDDNIRTMTTVMLTKAGYDVEAAVEGKTGVACYRQQRADVVITDILMPTQDGFETIRQLTRFDPQVKIIAVSGRVEGQVLSIAARLGAARVLIKPFTREELLAAVADCL